MRRVHPVFHYGETVDDYSVVRPLFLAESVQVYEVLNTHLQRTECLKLLTPRHPLDVSSQWDEARRASQTGHPGIVPVYRTGVVRSPTTSVNCPWFTMAYGEYGDLYRLKDFMDESGWDPVRQRDTFLTLLTQVACTLDDLHRLDRPVVHGDIKPGNIVVSGHRSGQLRALISDFGLNMAGEGHRSMGGTPAYMAPECFEESAAHPTRDRYAFAVMVFEMLCGRRPLEVGTDSAHSWEIYTAYADIQKHAPRPRFSDYFPGAGARSVDELFRRALSVNPAERPESCTAFITDIGDALTGARRRRRAKKAVVAGAAALIVVGGGAALATGYLRDSTPEGSLHLQGACPSTDVLASVNAAQEGSRFDAIEALDVASPQDKDVDVHAGCALAIGMKSPNPSIQHSEGWTLYLFNPSGSSDSESVRRAKDSALQSFFRVQQNRDKALSDGTRVRVQTTSDYQDADGIRSTVCAVEDWGMTPLPSKSIAVPRPVEHRGRDQQRRTTMWPGHARP